MHHCTPHSQWLQCPRFCFTIPDPGSNQDAYAEAIISPRRKTNGQALSLSRSSYLFFDPNVIQKSRILYLLDGSMYTEDCGEFFFFKEFEQLENHPLQYLTLDQPEVGYWEKYQFEKTPGTLLTSCRLSDKKPMQSIFVENFISLRIIHWNHQPEVK